MTPIDDLLNAAKHGKTSEIERLLPTLNSEDIERSDALREAAKNGHAQCVRLLADELNALNIFSVLEEVRHGDLACVRELICAIDSKVQHKNALYYATQQENVEMIEFLIPLSDPYAHRCLALRHAAENGKTECLKRLIPVSDPNAYNSQALRSTLIKQYMDCVEILYPVSNTTSVLEQLEADALNSDSRHPMHSDTIRAYQTLKSMMEKDKIEYSIDGLNQPSSHSRKL